MSTAEDVLRARQAQEARDTVASASEYAEQVATRHEAAVQRFEAAIKAAAEYLDSAGFSGGVMKLQWMGGKKTKEVAVWYLPVFSFSGSYYFSPTQLAVLVNPLGSDEDVRRHARDVTKRGQHPEYHYAVGQHWLLLMSSPSTELLEALTAELEKLVRGS